MFCLGCSFRTITVVILQCNETKTGRYLVSALMDTRLTLCDLISMSFGWTFYQSIYRYIKRLNVITFIKMEDIRRVTFIRNELLSDVHVRRSNINGFFYLIYGVKYITLGNSPL